MRLPDVVTATEAAERWWKAWRRVDFSWVSLAAKGYAEAAVQDVETLQDYWRRDPATGVPRNDAALIGAGELEKGPDGRLWHLVHAPLHWDDGSPTWKADRTHAKWADFWSLIEARLEASSVEDFGVAANDDAEGDAPPPAELGGVVFGETPADWAWHGLFAKLNANFTTSAFLGPVSFSGVCTVAGLDLRHCLFASSANFDDVEVDGDLEFSGSTFLARLEMARPEIAQRLELSSCDVRGEFTLLDASVGGALRCRNSAFHRPCGIEGTTIRDDFELAWCRFLNVVSLASVRFRQDATVLSASFEVGVDLSGRCYGDFHCVDNSFGGDAMFALFVVRGKAWFHGCRFDGTARFQKLRLRGEASWRNVRFGSHCEFRQVRFRREVAFHNTLFEGVADLTGCDLPRNAAWHHGAFRGADFRRTADFTIEGFTAWGAFAECNFQQRVLLPRKALESEASYAVAFDAAEQAASAQSGGDPHRAGAERDRRFAELESAFQALKQAMARQQARRDEHRFYRQELLAHGRRPGTSVLERALLALYDGSSRCGTSFVRPLAWLAGSVLVFGLGFWVASLPSGEIMRYLNPAPARALDPNLFDALRLSIDSVVQPLGAWKPQPADAGERGAWAKAFMDGGDASRYVLVRLVVSAQSLLSIALLFLAALGLKRRFQMSA